MARNRVIYQSEAVYVTQGAYDGPNLTSKDSAGVPTGVRNLDRVQSANYSFSIARQDVNQFGELAAIDRIITDTPTVSFDTSYIMANLSNENLLGFEVTQSGTANAASKMVSCISGLINAETAAYQKNYFILTTKEGADAVNLTDSGRYESIIGIGNGFISSYSTEAAVGGLPTTSISVEGMNMNFVNLPYSGYSVGGGSQESKGANANAGWWSPTPYAQANGIISGISGANPAINPTNGTKVGDETDLTSSAFVVLPVASGNAGVTNNAVGGGDSAAISALRPGDITLTLVKKTSDALTESLLNASSTTSNLIQGADIADAHIQGYTLSFDLSRTPIQRLGTKFAYARPVDFPITSSLSIDAVLADLTTGTISDIINCDDEYDAVIKMKDPRCTFPDGSTTMNRDIVCFVARGLKIDSESFTSSIGDNKSVTLDFSSQIGGPEQKGVGVFMSGYFGSPTL